MFTEEASEMRTYGGARFCEPWTVGTEAVAVTLDGMGTVDIGAREESSGLLAAFSM